MVLDRLIKVLSFACLCFAFRFTVYAQDTLKFGIDVLKEEHFERPEGKNPGILIHAPATDSDNVPTYKVFLNSEIKDKIVCFFSPEYGLSATAKAGERVENERLDGIHVCSLCKNEGSGKEPKYVPTEPFKHTGTPVADLHYVGVRCYTYITCIRSAIEQCIRYGKHVIVSARPNPLGRKISGSFMNEELQGYMLAVFVSRICTECFS